MEADAGISEQEFERHLIANIRLTTMGVGLVKPVLMASCVSLLLAACGGGDNGYCAGSFLRGTTSSVASSCPGCSVASEASAIDDQAGSFADLTFGVSGGQITLRATAPTGTTFQSGTRPGALMRFPPGNFTNVGVTFTLYRNGAPVSSGTGGAFTNVGQVDGAGNDTFAGRRLHLNSTPSRPSSACRATRKRSRFGSTKCAATGRP